MTDFDMADTSSPDCFVITLAEMRADYHGKLAQFLKTSGARNVIITMQADIKIGGKAAKPYGAALAVTYDYAEAVELMTLAKQAFDAARPFAFGWVPADLYGTDKFGIFIEQGTLGDKLANGLIDDIIVTLEVEEAVISSAQ